MFTSSDKTKPCKGLRVSAPSPSMNLQRYYGYAACVCVAMGITLFVGSTLTPYVGRFHDDGIYTAVAKSLAEGTGYRLVNLPGEPYQTKYPPVYSTLLAGVWRITPDFPRNVFYLKAVNLAFVMAALVAMAALVRKHNGGSEWLVPIAAQLALGTNPMLVAFADYLMTDVMFTALVASALALWMHNADSSSVKRDIGGALLVGVVILTRSVGIALAAAVTLTLAWRREYVRAALHGGTALIVFGAWMTWASLHKVESSPLVAYYQEYERPAFAYLLTNPTFTIQVISGNLQYAFETMPWTLGPLWLVAWPVLAVLLVTGMWALARSGWELPVLFFVCYAPLILLHPFIPFRYVLPLAPVLILALIAGSRHLWSIAGTVIRGGTIATRAPALVLTVMVIGNVAWLHYYTRPDSELRGWAGTAAEYRWSGFEETFLWIRSNTRPEARLGAIFDPLYFIYTDRQGVRPWFHRPETYFYPFGNPQPSVGEAKDVARELHGLGITYLIFDPPTGYSEGDAAIEMFRQLVKLPEVNARLVFTSSDEHHQIYRLWTEDPTGLR